MPSLMVEVVDGIGVSAIPDLYVFSFNIFPVKIELLVLISFFN